MSTNSTSNSTARATPQGGVLEGGNPVHYDAKNPIVLFIIQAGIIIIFCRLLHWPLSKIRQPRVIAEVIGGILLGPSVFGRIPGFTNAIFPAAAMANLNLVANLGLVLFLFLVGLEVDVRFVTANWRVALMVGVGGMAVPFGLGCGIAVGVYNHFPAQEPISFGVFLLFVGVAMAITAFPVLCRILSELKLLNTPVGLITLAAGVGNDVVGWILLALCVALVNAGSGLTALWVLLVAVGYTLMLVYALRPVMLWYLRRSGALRNGPSQSDVALILLLVLTSAFFTQIIGIHAIFGGFLVGIILPHESGFARKITEKIEDLIGALFLPLYFTLSGLNTNIGLLNSGTVWGYVIAIIAVAFFGKFIGASLAARLAGQVWREAFSIGALMSCKGLVELIVLNIGLQAKILSTQTFTMFVVMALVTTFATTPLTVSLYPPWYQVKIAKWKRGEIEWETGEPVHKVVSPDRSSSTVALEELNKSKVQKLLIYLRLDNMPSILTFLNLLSSPQQLPEHAHPSRPSDKSEARDTDTSPERPQRRVTAHGVRLISLQDRPSSVMQMSEIEEYSLQDPVVNIFRSLGQLHHVPASGEVDVVPEDTFADTLVGRASDYQSDMLFLPWSESGTLSEVADLHKHAGVTDGSYSHFVLKALQSTTCNAAVFVSQSAQTPIAEGRVGLHRTKSTQSLHSLHHVRDFPRPAIIASSIRHVYTPLFGGPDDILALALTVQLVEKGCSATIVRFVLPDLFDDATKAAFAPSSPREVTSPTGNPGFSRQGSTFTGATIPPTTPERDSALFESLQSSLSTESLNRIVFETKPVSGDASAISATVLSHASSDIGSLSKRLNSLVVVGRNVELQGLSRAGTEHTESERCLGTVGYEIVKSDLKGSFVVVKAKTS